MKLATRIASVETLRTLPAEVRRLYVQDGDAYVLDIETGDDWNALADHSEWGPLVRAYARQREIGQTLEERVAELEARQGQGTCLPADFDAALWARRDALLGTSDMRRRHAAAIEEIEEESAAEIAVLREERLRWETWISQSDRTRALRKHLAAAGVITGFLSAVTAMLEDEVEMIDGRLLARTPMGHLDAGEFCRRWATTDEAAAYLSPDAPRHIEYGAAPPGDSFSALVRRLR